MLAGAILDAQGTSPRWVAMLELLERSVSMDAHIDLDPQVASQLIALAEERGVTVEELLKEFVEQAYTIVPKKPVPRDEFEADMLAFAEGTENLQSPYPGDYSREDIYFDHD
jgi:hypothetical protein